MPPDINWFSLIGCCHVFHLRDKHQLLNYPLDVKCTFLRFNYILKVRCTSFPRFDATNSIYSWQLAWLWNEILSNMNTSPNQLKMWFSSLTIGLFLSPPPNYRMDQMPMRGLQDISDMYWRKLIIFTHFHIKIPIKESEPFQWANAIPNNVVLSSSGPTEPRDCVVFLVSVETPL